MTRVLTVPYVVLTMLLLGGVPGLARAQSQPALNGYAVLGLQSVRIGPGARVQPGAVGVTAGSIRLAGAAAVPGSVVGDTIRVARRTQVGRLFCNVVSGGRFGPGVVGGPVVGGGGDAACRKLTTPVVDPALLAPVTGAPGTQDLTVAARSVTSPFAAGSFGAVVVRRGGVLQLAGGSYQMRSIRLARAARLVCVDDCRITVTEKVRLARRPQLGAAQGLGARRARVDMTSTLADGTPDFLAAPRAIVAATIFAPNGDIVLGAHGEYRGAYVGRSVWVRPGGVVREDSAFPPPPRR